MMATHESDSDSPPADDEASSDRAPMSRRGVVGTIAGVSVLIAIASWVGWAQASQPVRWRDVGFEIVSPTQAQITFDVFLYTDKSVTCHVRALNRQIAEVGATSVAVDTSAGNEQRLTTEISTVEEATTAVVNFCEVRVSR